MAFRLSKKHSSEANVYKAVMEQDEKRDFVHQLLLIDAK